MEEENNFIMAMKFALSVMTLVDQSTLGKHREKFVQAMEELRRLLADQDSPEA